MKCACPSCGRRTEIEPELGDFPTSCQRCGSLFRPPVIDNTIPLADPGAPPTATPPIAAPLRGRPVYDADPQARYTRVQQGALAGLLTTRNSPEPASAGSPIDSTPDDELARVQARQKAMRRAELNGSLQSLRALGTLGIALIAVLCSAAAALGFKSVWSHPRTSRADTSPKPVARNAQ